jgi:hypothetical protein
VKAWLASGAGAPPAGMAAWSSPTPLAAASEAGLGKAALAPGAAPWVDLFQGKTPVASVAHNHGPPCTGLGKMVDFPLQPGDYWCSSPRACSRRPRSW